jgi:peptide chain release factor 2
MEPDNIEIIKQRLKSLESKLNYSNMSNDLIKIDKNLEDPNIWQNRSEASLLAKKKSNLEDLIKKFKKIHDNLELISLMKDEDQTMISQLVAQTNNDLDGLNKIANLSGVHDSKNAIIKITAGAGGVDAQDWAEMLLKMYLSYGQGNKDAIINLVEKVGGQEAGIKSATIEVLSPYAYGYFKNENGVHRLVRISPFNSGKTRETSFAMVEVMPDIEFTPELGIKESDLKIDYYRSSGKGGQSVNTTDSAVRITHLPSNISVSIQNERSQTQNKDLALKILISKLASMMLEQHKDSIDQLRGPNLEAAWGNQIRNYVMHPYTLVKDARTKKETTNIQDVLNGGFDIFW